MRHFIKVQVLMIDFVLMLFVYFFGNVKIINASDKFMDAFSQIRSSKL